MNGLNKIHAHEFQSKLGKQLYALLPELYRMRDSVLHLNEKRQLGDLARLFDAHGYLLDLVYNTLKQRLADCFPDDPGSGGRACQDWLIPYFARLVDARLVSSDPAARRAEVANAISWRQRKGTLVSIGAISKELLGDEVFLQEGINRVATTPTIGQPLMPLAAFGISQEGTIGKRINTDNPGWASKHPALPACMVDMRCVSRVVESEQILPTSKSLSINGIDYHIRQVNHHGVPETFDSYDDISVRTVDVRIPDWRVGHSHPNRVLVYTPTPMGIFPYSMVETDTISEPIRHITIKHDLVKKDERKIPNVRLFVKRIGNHPVRVAKKVELPKDLKELWKDTPANLGFTRIENTEFNDILHVTSGKLHLYGVKAKEVMIDIDNVADTLLVARDCLFEKVTIKNGRIDLENCTVLKTTQCAAIKAKNCIFNGGIHYKTDHDYPLAGEIRNSRIEADLKEYVCLDNVSDCFEQREHWLLKGCETETPSFFTDDFPKGGAGVIKPDTSSKIYQGAENNSEMGAYNLGRKRQPLVITDPHTILVPKGCTYVLQDLIFTKKVTVDSASLGTLRLDMIAASHLLIEKRDQESGSLSSDEDKCSTIATNSLFEIIEDMQGTVQLEYCTVFNKIFRPEYVKLLASDCIFADDTDQHFSKPTKEDCIRFSRIPPKIMVLASDQIRFTACIDEIPQFANSDFSAGSKGVAGCGVLSQVSSDNICGGAEDGGEMGVYHGLYYCVKQKDLKAKLNMYLPYQIKPVLIYQQDLHEAPQQLEAK